MTSKAKQIIVFNPLNPEMSSLFLEKSPEPDWTSFLYKNYPSSFQQEFLSKITESHQPFSYFIKGLTKEFGSLNFQINLQEALEAYHHGAELNDPFCNFKLYYIYSFDFLKFSLNCDRDQAMLCLIRSSCFSDSTIDIKCELIKPLYQLELHLRFEDQEVFKCKKLLRILQEKERSNIGKLNSFIFLELWLSYEYALDEEDKQNSFTEMENAAAEGNLQAGYFVARNLINNQDMQDRCQNLLYQVCERMPSLPSYHLLGGLFENMKNIEMAVKYYRMGVENNDFQSLIRFSCLMMEDFSFEQNVVSVAQMLMNAFSLGHQTAAHAYIDLTIYLRKANMINLCPEMEKTALELAVILYNCKEGLNSEIKNIGANYYLLAQCLSKGIGAAEKNKKKALKIIKKGIEDPKVKEKRALYYLQALLEWKMFIKENSSQENFSNLPKSKPLQLVFEKAFKMYAHFIEDDKQMKSSQHFYKIGYMYEKGLGTKANPHLAKKFYTIGANESKLKGILPCLYAKRCRAKLLSLCTTSYNLKYN